MPSRSASPEAIATAALDVTVRPRAGISLHLIDDEGVLLDSADQKLYRLNATGAFIWCCIEEGASTAGCIARLRSTFDLSDRNARSYVAAAVDGWASLGLLAASPASAPPARAPAVVAEPQPLPPFAAVCRSRYRLLDTVFELRFASAELAAYTARFLAPLRDRGADTGDAVIIDVRENGEHYALYHGDRLLERWVARHELVPAAKIVLVMAALERSGDFGALHAGAACRRLEGPCVVIAGPSGAGKSTLVAGLTTSGFHSLGDDTIALDRHTLAVRPVPFGICLKDGAWDLLSARIPELSDLPVHRRLDGKRVKYLVPSNAPAALGRAAFNPACAVIFPIRVESGGAELIRLSPAEALTRLAPEFCPLGGELTTESVDRLIGWVRGMTCLEMRYSLLDDGIKAIGELSS
jgi:Coenzyme PQQ synthesis protein D (PqqD)